MSHEYVNGNFLKGPGRFNFLLWVKLRNFYLNI